MRRRGGFARVLLPFALLLPARLSAQAPEAGPLEGEYGLWVEVHPKTLDVHWITERPDSGTARLLANGIERSVGGTGAARVHAVTLPWSGLRTAELEFGSASSPADRHRVSIDLRAPARQGAVFPAVDSLFVLGDVHGEYDRLRQLLGNAGLVDARGHWSGGKRQLAFLGDLVDRGPEATRMLWFVHALEREARQAGGRVLVVLGNHEVMVISGDVRYTQEKELRLARSYGVPYPKLLDPQSSVLGRWLASKPAVMRVGRVLLVHGGVTPAFAATPLAALDDSLAAYVKEELFTKWSDSTYVPRMDAAALARRTALFWGDDGPLWERGYAQTDTLGAALDRTLAALGSDVMVIGHTPMPTMTARYDGKVIAAHPRQPALEMLLLVRSKEGYERWRYGLTGPPERF